MISVYYDDIVVRNLYPSIILRTCTSKHNTKNNHVLSGGLSLGARGKPKPRTGHGQQLVPPLQACSSASPKTQVSSTQEKVYSVLRTLERKRARARARATST